MRKLTQKQIVERMHTMYLRRLHEVLGETDVKDKRGNVVISPGLKVRHKKSQFEYTVSSVRTEPKTGKVVITLKSPELPRFTPRVGEEFMGEEPPTGAAQDLQDPASTTHDQLISAMTQEAKRRTKGRSKKSEASTPATTGKLDAQLDASPADEDTGGETVFVVDEKEFKKDYEVK